MHLARKFWHFFGVITIAVFYHNLSRPMAVQVLTLFTAVAILIDILRQRLPGLNRYVIYVMHPIMRDSEKNGLAGTTFLLTGALIIVVVFPPKVVMLSLLFLAVADPVASYFGIRYGRDRLFRGKSLQGTLAAFVACTLIAGGYFFAHNLMTERLVIVSLLSGMAGALAELVPVGRVDDNLVLPVVSSVLLYGIYFLFGGF